MHSSSRGARAFFLFFSCGVFLCAQQQSAVSPATPIAGMQNATPPMNMGLVAPLVIESASWTSVLTTVNESKTPVHVLLVLQTPNGEQADKRTIFLPGHSSQRTPIGALLPESAPDFIGFLTAMVQEAGPAQNMAVAAQLTLIGKADRAGTSVDQELEMPMMGSHLKAVTDGPATLLAIQNAGMETAQVNLTCVQSGVTAHIQFPLAANTVRLVRGCESLQSGGDQNSAGGVLSAASASAGSPDIPSDPVAFDIEAGTAALAAFGLSFPSEQTGRTGGVIFVDQSGFTSQSTVFAGIPVGESAILPGAVFAPRLALANLSAVPRTVIVRAAFDTAPETPVIIGKVVLSPFETMRFDPAPAAKTQASFETLLVDQDGTPGDVIAALTDRDEATHALLTPLPKFLQHANNGGAHPWSIEPGVNSTLVLFNGQPKPQLVNLNLGAIGIVWSDTLTLQPYETRALSIRDIIATANLAKGSAVPKIAMLRGEISWFTPGQADVFGRVLITSNSGGDNVVESYSCGSNIVLCGMSMYNPFAAIDYFNTGYIGPLAPQFCASWAPTQCSGTQYGSGSASSYRWNSTNSGVTPISGSATQSSVGLYGQFLGTGGGSGTGYAGYCQAGSTGSAQVTPKITWNNNDITNQTEQALIGQQLSLIVTPTGSNVSWSIASGTTVGGWNPSSNSASYSSVTKNSSTLTFYNLTPVSGQKITATVTVNGLQYSASTTFNVSAPSAYIITSTGQDEVNQSDPGHVGWWLYFGGEPSTDAGITFTAGPVTVPSGFQSGGAIEFVQIMNNFREQREDFQGSWYHINFDNINYLDTEYPYQGGPWPTGSFGAVVSDTPGSYLDQYPDLQYYRWDVFTTYLLWQSSYPNSIFVPVARIPNWFWVGAVTKSGTAWSFTNTANSAVYGWSVKPASTEWNGPLTWSANNSIVLTASWQSGMLPQ